jgi:hypothetical protein
MKQRVRLSNCPNMSSAVACMRSEGFEDALCIIVAWKSIAVVGEAFEASLYVNSMSKESCSDRDDTITRRRRFCVMEWEAHARQTAATAAGAEHTIAAAAVDVQQRQ